jgi:23S rRNA (uridine2552-2'-O)-methyltransferase
MSSRKKAKGNRWQDHYTLRARKEKWPARSVYKLSEIDKKFKLIHWGHFLLDLGCYPGSWSQYSAKKVGPTGEVTGVDLKKPERLSVPNFRFIKADIRTLDIAWLAGEIGPRDVVLSDVAPQTSGIRVADSCLSMELAAMALSISASILKKKGHFLCKVFEGEDLKDFKNEFHRYFKETRVIRPSAVRKRSREIYLLGLSFHP